MTTTTDAVEALTRALWPYSTEVGVAIPRELKSATVGVMKRILDAGFTIVRQPVMSEEELEREARKLCTAQNIYWDKSQPATHYMTEDAAIALAKRYRGQS